LPREETTPPVMKMYRAMGPNLYPAARDSTRAKTIPSRRYPMPDPRPYPMSPATCLPFGRHRCSRIAQRSQAFDFEHDPGQKFGILPGSRPG
jgi:hypothetical protein